MEKDIFDIGFEWLIHHIGWAGILIAFAGLYITAMHFQNKER